MGISISLVIENISFRVPTSSLYFSLTSWKTALLKYKMLEPSLTSVQHSYSGCLYRSYVTNLVTWVCAILWVIFRVDESTHFPIYAVSGNEVWVLFSHSCLSRPSHPVEHGYLIGWPRSANPDCCQLLCRLQHLSLWKENKNFTFSFKVHQ